jgi:hypothetical protein
MRGEHTPDASCPQKWCKLCLTLAVPALTHTGDFSVLAVMYHYALALLLVLSIGSCGSAAKPPPKSALDIYAASAPALVTIEAGTNVGLGFVVAHDGLSRSSHKGTEWSLQFQQTTCRR